MVQLLCQDAELYPQFRERILHMECHADRIGWGYGDLLWDQIDFLEDELTDGGKTETTR